MVWWTKKNKKQMLLDYLLDVAELQSSTTLQWTNAFILWLFTPIERHMEMKTYYFKSKSLLDSVFKWFKCVFISGIMQEVLILLCVTCQVQEIFQDFTSICLVLFGWLCLLVRILITACLHESLLGSSWIPW